LSASDVDHGFFDDCLVDRVDAAAPVAEYVAPPLSPLPGRLPQAAPALPRNKSHQRRAAALSCLLSNFRTDCGERGKVLETITGLEVLRKRAGATHERLNEVRSYRTTLAEELDRITRAEELNERQRQ
jgi:hypothetical protein